MSNSKKRLLFDVAIAEIIYLGMSINGAFDPIKCNPYRDEIQEVIPSKERRQQLADTGIMALGVALRQMFPYKRNRP
jgi:hypothetical protein